MKKTKCGARIQNIGGVFGGGCVDEADAKYVKIMGVSSRILLP